MVPDDFHEKPFDDGTLTKLKIFELYAREWLPVFLSKEQPKFSEIHIYDFFAGAGTDSNNVPGSPIRMLRQLQEYQQLPSWSSVKFSVHFFDKSAKKIVKLKASIAQYQNQLPQVNFNIEALDFNDAFQKSKIQLSDKSAAKLVLIDPFGVDVITPEVFEKLISFPVCDFLFFLPSSILYRFCEHPAIKQKVKRPDDYYSCHRAALEYYRELIPKEKQYFLAPFSIKKGSNIYGIIFGSAHPLGISKFLDVAWKNDQITGEANYDIERHDILPGQSVLSLFGEPPVRKLAIFEQELDSLIRSGSVHSELDVMRVCFEHGVRPREARNVLGKLKQEGIIELDFNVPDVKKWKSPRPLK